MSREVDEVLFNATMILYIGEDQVLCLIWKLYQLKRHMNEFDKWYKIYKV